MNTTTFNEQDFVAFSYSVSEWVARLGLTGWTYEVRHEQIGENVVAQCSYDTKKRNALFRLTKSVEFDFGAQTNPEALALHEVLHLLLADLVGTAATLGDDSHDLSVGKEHEVINRLMKVLK